MAFTEIYVDPLIAADSGTGTIGDPFGDLEYALEETDWDATNGIRVNIKAGTDEVLDAELSVAMASTVSPSKTVAWAPTFTAQCVFQGYTATAGDGGVGGVSGGGAVSCYNDTALNYVSFIDLHLHSCGTNSVINCNNNCNVIRCEIDNTSGSGIATDTDAVVVGNYVHNVGTYGIEIGGGYCAYNRVENGTNLVDYAIFASVTDAIIHRNIIRVSGASGGIIVSTLNSITSNSIWSDGGTGKGIQTNAINKTLMAVINNVVSGFSGAGGVGFDFGTNAGTTVALYAGNSAYNNTTNYSAPEVMVDDFSASNETLTADPFTDPSNGDMSPVDTGTIKEGSVPQSFHSGV